MPVSWVKNGVSASILRGQGTCATFALHALSLEEISLATAELFFRGALRDPSGSPMELGMFDQVKEGKQLGESVSAPKNRNGA